MLKSAEQLTMTLSLTVCMLFLGIGPVAAQSPPSQREPTVEEWKELKERTSRIEKELAELKDHAWAGVYSTGNGYVGTALYVAPKSGFVFSPYADTYDKAIMEMFDYGEIKIEGGRFYLHFARWGVSEEIFFVQWGKRHFLIEERDVPNFINAVNAGCDQFQKENGVLRHSLNVKDGEHTAPLFGAPSLPEQFREMVFKTPITVSISSVRESTTENPAPEVKTYPWRWRTTRVKLDAGKDKGLWKGMKLYAQGVKDANGETAYAYVTDIDEHSAEAGVLMTVNVERQEPPLPAAGWQFTSRLKEPGDASLCR